MKQMRLAKMATFIISMIILIITLVFYVEIKHRWMSQMRTRMVTKVEQVTVTKKKLQDVQPHYLKHRAFFDKDDSNEPVAAYKVRFKDPDVDNTSFDLFTPSQYQKFRPKQDKIVPVHFLSTYKGQTNLMWLYVFILLVIIVNPSLVLWCMNLFTPSFGESENAADIMMLCYVISFALTTYTLIIF